MDTQMSHRDAMVFLEKDRERGREGGLSSEGIWLLR